MTTELTKAAQQALEALKLCYDVVEYPANGTSRQDKAIAALERALTQRPAAQTERDILNDSAWIAGAKFGWNCGVEGTRDLLNQCIEQRIKDRVEARASLPAPQRATPATPEDMKVYDGIAAGYFADTQQATPEPLTLGPLAKRNIYDAIRGAYDLGYNDARNARTVPGDSAPGYDGRSVEEDHGGALFNLLSKRLTPATPEPLIVKGAMAGMVDAQVRDLWPTKGATPEPVGEPLPSSVEAALRHYAEKNIEWVTFAKGEREAQLARLQSSDDWQRIDDDGRGHEQFVVTTAKAEAALQDLIEWQGRNATRPAPGVPEWQPIETAPKDGRDLILLLTPSGFPQVTYSNTWWQSGFSVECRPTGWMPLPAHPLAAAQAKGGQP